MPPPARTAAAPVTLAVAGVMFAAGLVILFVVHWLAVRRSRAPLPPGGLLLAVETAPETGITGVEREERLPCPRRARAALEGIVDAGRGVMYRDGAHWIVATGAALTVRPVAGGQRTVHYLRVSAPRLVDGGGGGTGAPSPPPPPPDLPGWRAHPGSTIAAAALFGPTGQTTAVLRFATVAELRQNLDTDRTDALVLHNGPHDPGFYVVRLPGGGGPAALITAPGLPGTVYTRAVTGSG